MFFLLYRHTDDGIFDNFLKISDHFMKISKDSPKFVREVTQALPNIFWKFPKISEDYWRLLKTFEEDLKMFQWYTNKFKYSLRDELDISKITNIFTSEDMENTPLKYQMWFPTNFTSSVFSCKTLVFI